MWRERRVVSGVAGKPVLLSVLLRSFILSVSVVLERQLHALIACFRESSEGIKENQRNSQSQLPPSWTAAEREKTV